MQLKVKGFIFAPFAVVILLVAGLLPRFAIDKSTTSEIPKERIRTVQLQPAADETGSTFRKIWFVPVDKYGKETQK